MIILAAILQTRNEKLNKAQSYIQIQMDCLTSFKMLSFMTEVQTFWITVGPIMVLVM